MAKSNAPKPWLVAFLQKWKVSVPPTHSAALTLYSYIARGNGTGGAEPADRARILAKNQSEWDGKKITGYHGTGVCMYIMAKYSNEIQYVGDARRVAADYTPVSPFKAFIYWDNPIAGGKKRTSIATLGTIKLA